MDITREELDALTESITRSILSKLEAMAASEVPREHRDLGESSRLYSVSGRFAEGAEGQGLHGTAQRPLRALARLIDHTLLRPDADEEQVRRLCEETIRYGFATVCINPTWVRLASSMLKGKASGICTVVGFPLGANAPDVKTYETRRAIFDGADEIDMVVNVGALKSKDYNKVEEDILGVVCCCKETGTLSKVIIEAALLSQEEKIKACTLVASAGADFVKTSTGFGPGGATVEDVMLIRQVVGEKLGIKAAGGVRDAVTARQMVEAGATRIGTSAAVRIINDVPASGSPVAEV
jgi:deoxyribose-phosphate aldolase